MLNRHSIRKALYWGNRDHNILEEQAENAWNTMGMIDKKELLKCASFSDKYAGMEFRHLTPHLKEMVKFTMTRFSP